MSIIHSETTPEPDYRPSTDSEFAIFPALLVSAGIIGLAVFICFRHVDGYTFIGLTGVNVVAGVICSQIAVMAVTSIGMILAGCHSRPGYARSLLIIAFILALGLALIPAIGGTTTVASGTGLVLLSLALPVAVSAMCLATMCVIRYDAWDNIRRNLLPTPKTAPG